MNNLKGIGLPVATSGMLKNNQLFTELPLTVEVKLPLTVQVRNHWAICVDLYEDVKAERN